MKTILLIEDEESLRRTLGERLVMEGYRVQTAASGEEGVRLIKAAPPDLILCDIMMPGMDGYGVLLALQGEPRWATIPFIFMTAKADPSQVRAGMELGADDYLCKPVSKADLLAAVSTQLWKRDRDQERLEHVVAATRKDVVRKLPHELLTPLTGLLSTADLLETAEAAIPVEVIRSLGRVIRLASQRLQHTIRSILLYAELQTADPHPEARARLRGTEHIPATTLTDDLAAHLAQQDARSGDLRLDLLAVEVVMAPSHFAEVIIQLLDNAFKFSTPGSAVLVRLALLPAGSCELTVQDHGRGMTPEQILQVGAFRQFDSDLWTQPGTGLGLALVGQLAALYGGSFTIESDPGNGTRAIVRLPNARAGSQPTSAP